MLATAWHATTVIHSTKQFGMLEMVIDMTLFLIGKKERLREENHFGCERPGQSNARRRCQGIVKQQPSSESE